MNRLSREKSPYLRQHASDPVDWYPWGKEAFEKARREDKPILLSIGYSSCHWCHVMHRESFSDPELASILNDTFVCIKVDREERPDLDDYFMEVCVRLTGSGGWPLTIFLTPDGKPFFAATYIPKKSRPGVIGLKDLALKVKDIWSRDRGRIFEIAEDIMKEMEGERIERKELKDIDGLIDEAYLGLKSLYDPVFGGFGKEPKFPTPSNIFFLFRYYRRKEEKTASDMALKQLWSMRWGGIYDQIGGGIHRYSVTRDWGVPHFEKMLYDQALVSMAYVEAYQVTGDDFYRKVAEDIFNYVLSDLRSEEGAFYTSEDAESEGEEGRFYLWTEEELRGVLSSDEFLFVKETFGIKDGKNILSWKNPPKDLTDERLKLWAHIRNKLKKVREKRVRPGRDEKILCDLNALMIASLAKASSVFGRSDLLSHAEAAWSFLEDKLWKGEGLMHRYMEGEASIPAFLDDYSFLGVALFELYEATLDDKWLDRWIVSVDEAMNRLMDEKEGGFFYSQGDPVIGRRKVFHEGSLPSSQAVMASNLIKLFRVTGEHRYRDIALKSLELLLSHAKDASWAHPSAMIAADLYLGPGWELTVTSGSKEEAVNWIRPILRLFLPEGVWIFKKDEGLGDGVLGTLCQEMSCSPPVSSLNKLMDTLLKAGRRYGRKSKKDIR